jgi:hypothetical protein
LAPVTGRIHQFDPHMAPDSDFEYGRLDHLVPGNIGRMLDRRRTPVRILALRPEVGTWICEVTAFEDAGARWELPFERVDRFQFALGSVRAEVAATRSYRATVRRLDRPLEIPRRRRGHAATERLIAGLRAEVAAWLDANSSRFPTRATLDPTARTGEPPLAAALEAFLKAHDLWEMEHVFTTTYVSHPGSGEVVKLHEMAIAELGLASFQGTVVRDPARLEPPWDMNRRKRHVLTRLAFVREALTRGGLAELTLYRAISAEGALEPVRPRTLVSATFSLEVAMSLFGDAADRETAALHRRRVPVERVLMTFLETAAMNRRFREAEAVLLADGVGPI